MPRCNAVVVLLAFVLSACTPAPKTIGQRVGPRELAPVTVESWTYEGASASRLTTPHYTIYTTIPDVEYTKKIAQVMEAAFTQYQQFTPGQVPSKQPMTCYIFDHRAQWADFTKRNTGVFSSIYLQINRGGYTLRDWYVSYDIGSYRTYSVAAHEGWHQFAYRNFIGRLPPFLEEGIACMFEDVQFKSNLPTFNLSVNPQRSKALRHAYEMHQLIPLEELMTLHAGQIVNRPGSTIETFYAENWAFARFLWEGEGGKYRPALLRLIADTSNGQVIDPTGSLRLNLAGWNPAAVSPMLQLYLHMNADELSKHFIAYIRTIAYEDSETDFAS